MIITLGTLKGVHNMEFKQGRYRLDVLVAFDQEGDVHLLGEAIEQLLNNVNSLKLDNDRAALIIEVMIQEDKIEEDEEA